MIEYVKTTFSCGHIEYKGSSFGNPPLVAEAEARDSGYLVEEIVEDVCPHCAGFEAAQKLLEEMDVREFFDRAHATAQRLDKGTM